MEAGKVSGVKPIIFSVHNTGISDEEAQTLAEYCDVVWACASRAVREIVGNRSKLQIGISIPVFGITQMGKRMILNRRCTSKMALSFIEKSCRVFLLKSSLNL